MRYFAFLFILCSRICLIMPAIHQPRPSGGGCGHSCRRRAACRDIMDMMEVTASLQGECGYCGGRIGEEEAGGEEEWLPLQCSSCQQLYHIGCLKGRRPPVLRGDRLWVFMCAICHPLHKETWNRPHLQWVHVIHLVLYHLMVTQEGKDGYFRWNEDICGCIQRNWQSLMPHRRRTQSWHSTVAGTLSVHCPSLFQSGAKELGEAGYWTLTSLTPPEPTPAMKAGSGGVKLGVEEEDIKKVGGGDVPVVMEGSSPSPSPPSFFPNLCTISPSHPPLSLMSVRQEAILLSHLTKTSVAIGYNPRASRLTRKLKMRQRQRNHGYPTFDLDHYITHCLSSTVKYVLQDRKPYSDQIVPIVCRVPSPPPSPPAPSTYHSILQHISSFPVLSASSPASRRMTFLSGRGHSLTPITSPYTARLLKPYIFRSKDIRPPQVSLLEDIVSHYIRYHGDSTPSSTPSPYTPRTLDLCYLQRTHVPGCNGLLTHFFWPVDISDCLTYPDSTCVALYGQLVVGCALMTPDAKVGEAYISFLLVHPHFSRAGLGKLMLYHLIQSCQGKDVTLHVSVDNPAMLLYQSFGFKAERYCLDFYDRYYPPSHQYSRHAYFMRLHR